ncbi:MAG: YkgJ family cysteine cluster protein [Cyanobacteria bacterium RUI128]|nr:YkgJ family cysteine cluster protein [Cyanobacteria bacterium RUI128]
MENYIKFLDYLMGNINNYFEEQAPYIKCKMGCAKCCSNGDYPFSEIELEYLKQGFNKLDEDTKYRIKENIKQIIAEKSQCNEGTYTYKCPFLIDNICSVYEQRGIICRTFGLIYLKEGAKMQIPFCAYEGLNYSNILDPEKDMLMADKMQDLGITVEPKAYNIHYSLLTSDKVGHAFQFEYGKKSSLVDLLANDKTFTP